MMELFKLIEKDVNGYFAACKAHNLMALTSIANDGGLYYRWVRQIDRFLIATVLKELKGNQTQAAKHLGINRNTLRSKMKEYGLK